MRSIRFAILAFHLGVVIPSLAVTVDLRSDETLKPFFDAGLRPKNIRGIMNSCEIGQTPIRILLPGDKAIEFEASSLTFEVDKHDRITQIQAFTVSLSLDEAKLLSERFHKEFGKPFDPCLAYLEKVKANWMWPGDEYYITSDTLPRIGMGFQIGGSKEKPLKMPIGIVWPREWKSVDRRREPIKPPPGYESVSMEQLPNPNLKIVGIAPVPNPPPIVQPPTPKASEARPTPNTSSEEPVSSTPLSIIFVLIVAATGLLWLLVKNNRK